MTKPDEEMKEFEVSTPVMVETLEKVNKLMDDEGAESVVHLGITLMSQAMVAFIQSRRLDPDLVHKNLDTAMEMVASFLQKPKDGPCPCPHCEAKRRGMN